MGPPQMVQQAQLTSTAATATTNTGTISAATAGNLLVAALAGDKNTGTVVFTDNLGGAWTEVVEVPGASVSTYLAYKVAAGGETTITATTSAPSTTGNTGRVIELSQDGTDSWTLVASSVPAYSDTTALSRSTGTTGTASFGGLAVAVAAVDTQNNVTSRALSLIHI